MMSVATTRPVPSTTASLQPVRKPGSSPMTATRPSGAWRSSASRLARKTAMAWVSARSRISERTSLVIDGRSSRL